MPELPPVITMTWPRQIGRGGRWRHDVTSAPPRLPGAAPRLSSWSHVVPARTLAAHGADTPSRRAAHPGRHRGAAARRGRRARDAHAAAQLQAGVRRRHVGVARRAHRSRRLPGTPHPTTIRRSWRRRPGPPRSARRPRRPASWSIPTSWSGSRTGPHRPSPPSASAPTSSPRRHRGRGHHRRRRDPRPRLVGAGRGHATCATPSRSSCRRPPGSPSSTWRRSPRWPTPCPSLASRTARVLRHPVRDGGGRRGRPLPRRRRLRRRGGRTAPAGATDCGCSTPAGATSGQTDRRPRPRPVACAGRCRSSGARPTSSPDTSVVTQPPSARAW